MKKLFTLILIVLALAGNAQHYITLTNGNIVLGKITSITGKNIHIISADSVHVYDVPTTQIVSYDAGKGIVNVKALTETKVYVAEEATAGDELIKAANVYYTGMIITAAGILISSAGSYAYGTSETADPKTQKAIVYIGSGIAVVGMIINITAFSHISKAGRKLNVTSGRDGLGVSMKF